MSHSTVPRRPVLRRSATTGRAPGATSRGTTTHAPASATEPVASGPLTAAPAPAPAVASPAVGHGTAPSPAAKQGADAKPSAAGSATATARTSRRHTRRNFLLGSGAALGIGLVGTGAWALNRYVIDHVEITDVEAYEAQNSSVTRTAAPTAANATLTQDGYTSSSTTVRISTVTTGSGRETVTYYTADITVSDATVVRSAFAHNEYGTNITARPSQIASSHDAFLAVNGDYYGFRDTGILIRNGVVYRDSPTRQGLVLYTDGRMEVYDETTTSAQALLDAGAWNTLSFGPALVQDGSVREGIDAVEVDTNFGNHSIQGRQPRTAVGALGQGHYVFVVVDGREEGYSRGVTMTELAQIMVDLGCQVAYNLDGGGSSTMYFNGQVINRPSNGGERGTSDILYIAQGA